MGTIKSRIALADVGKYAWSAIFTFRLANCWEKKYQQHKLIRRMMQEINCIYHKRQPLNLTKILFIGDESQKNCDKNISWLFFSSGNLQYFISMTGYFIPRMMSRIIKNTRNALYLFDIVSPCNPADMNTYLVLHIYRHYCTCADRPLLVKHKTMNSNRFTFM